MDKEELYDVIICANYRELNENPFDSVIVEKATFNELRGLIGVFANSNRDFDLVIRNSEKHSASGA